MKKNLKTALREEIALEGLDGITFQALWIRLSEATSTKLPYTDRFKQYIWHIIKILPYFEFFELQEPRPDLITFNRMNCKDVPTDIYPHFAVEDSTKNIKGSCSTYHTRINISTLIKNLNYEDVYNKWGSKFVIVANQKLREEMLFDCKGTFSNISVTRYCMLERIGRSRYNGEITYGQNSLLALGEEPKSLFYHRKTLLEANIIKKQIYNQKWGIYTYNGTLLHLKRFFKEEKPKFVKFTEIVVQYLKTKNNNMATYDEIREIITKKTLKMLTKTPEFHIYVSTDMSVPYREIYPDAPKEEWQLKGNKKEKQIHVIKLKDPNTSVESTSKIDTQNQVDNQSKLRDCTKLTLNQSYLTQVCRALRTFGSNGCSETEIRNHLGLTKLTARILTRNLVRKNMLASFLIDDGRQRINRYCYKEFENVGEMALKFDMQRKETLELLLDNMESNTNNSDEME